ncbi:MAG TPA: hypothetical protein VJR89_04265 [Polyangiales bacterium]|nr:hypothetical protein [Polyangiales bacterium]
MATRGRIKGAAIRDFIAWYAREHDLERLKRAIRQLPEQAQAAFDFNHGALGVLPSTWFEAADVHRVLDILTEGLSPAAYEELARTGGHATVQGLMTGVQRIVFTRFMTPGAYSKLATIAFRLNYDAGEVVTEELGPRRHAGNVLGWTAHHPFLCRMHVAIKVEIYAAMGCQGARIEQRYCRSDGDARCGSIIVWDESE